MTIVLYLHLDNSLLYFQYILLHQIWLFPHLWFFYLYVDIWKIKKWMSSQNKCWQLIHVKGAYNVCSVHVSVLDKHGKECPWWNYSMAKQYTMACYSSQTKYKHIQKWGNSEGAAMVVPLTLGIQHCFSSLKLQEIQIIVPYFEILATLYHLSSWVKSLTSLHNERHITEYLTTSWMEWHIFKSLSLEIKLLDVT